MEIKIVEEKEAPFFKRKDLRLEVSHESSPTPSKDELTKELAAEYKVADAQVVIDYLFTKKGEGRSVAKVKILKEKPQERPKEKPKEAQKEAGEEKTTEKSDGKK